MYWVEISFSTYAVHSKRWISVWICEEVTCVPADQYELLHHTNNLCEAIDAYDEHLFHGQYIQRQPWFSCLAN